VWCDDCKPEMGSCEVCAIEDSDIWDKVFEDRWKKKNAGVDSDHYDPPDGEDLDDLVPERDMMSFVKGDPTALYCPRLVRGHI